MNDDRLRNGLEVAEDRILAGRAADGDTAAFAVLVRRYTPMMRAYARRILHSSAEVDDVVQDTFITAWSSLPELEDTGKVKSWLMRIASRKAVDRLRATRPHADIESLDPPSATSASPPRVAESRASAVALRVALQELPDAQRACWVLRELGEHTYEEIAEDLDIPLSTVRGLLARARKYMIIRMEEWR